MAVKEERLQHAETRTIHEEDPFHLWTRTITSIMQMPSKEFNRLLVWERRTLQQFIRSNGKQVKVNDIQTQPPAAPTSYHDYSRDYTPIYFNSNVHSLKTTTSKILNHTEPEVHVRSLWLNQELSSQVFWIDCEADTRASCNILPVCKAKALFGKEI